MVCNAIGAFGKEECFMKPLENNYLRFLLKQPLPFYATFYDTEFLTDEMRVATPKVTKPRPNPPILREPHDKGFTYNRGMSKLNTMLAKPERTTLKGEEGMLEEEERGEDGVFAALKARRQEEEHSLDFLDENRSVHLHERCTEESDNFYNNRLGEYIFKRARRPAGSEIELKAKFKRSYANKNLFAQNRTERNEEYVCQRKRDFAVSQKRVERLIGKLVSEYESSVGEQLKKCVMWTETTQKQSGGSINELTTGSVGRICDSAIELTAVADALSFIPTFYTDIVKFFHSGNIPFSKTCEKIPVFMTKSYVRPVRPDVKKLFVTLSEACEVSSMVPTVLERRGRAVSVLMKPLLFTDEECAQMASKFGWTAVFANQFDNPVQSVFELLSKTEKDVMVFGFPRTPQELEEICGLFNPRSLDDEHDRFLPRPVQEHVTPFDMILELDIADEVIIRDILAVLEDTEDGSRYDVRDLTLDSETQLVRLRNLPDPKFDVIQYPSRAVSMKANFELIAEVGRDIFKTVQLGSRVMDQEMLARVEPLFSEVPEPTKPSYPEECIFEALMESVKSIPEELKVFIIGQWNLIQSNYNESVKRAFELLNSAHLLMIGHLERARREMHTFLRRPGSSQSNVIEFQQWHCGQVERVMRRMQKVKDECALRLNALRESLLQIESDRKTEEELKQKDLLNAPFRTTLFELVNNACTSLAQAEIDRWTATRCLMIDVNQVVSDVDLVPPLPRKKLTMVVDPSRMNQKKGAKKPARTTPPSRNRTENKLQSFESPLFEQIEMIKKYITDASVIFRRITTPVSVRGKARPVKDKNPFAPYKITALDEFLPAFEDDDVYLVAKMDQVAEMAREELQVVQQAFDAFVDDSSQWIQAHFMRRKAIADTAVAYMGRKVNEEAQLNQLVILQEDKCIVDLSKLLVATEESPKIPLAFPETMVEEAKVGKPEDILRAILQFEQDNNAQ